MANERLRDAVNRAGLTANDIAAEVGVDPKTVERWITRDRTPYPRHRHKVAAMVGESETYLWPASVADGRQRGLSDSELIRTYPRRAQIPRELWKRLIDGATNRIDVLVYAGLFFPEQQPSLAQTLCDKVSAGADVRLLLAQPDGLHVIRRGIEEGIGDAVVARVKNALSFYRPHVEHDCVEIRLHDTTLYNSIFRFDNEMLVNTHVFGLPAAHAPVIHLRRLVGGELFSIYEDSFDRVWERAEPARGQLDLAQHSTGPGVPS